MFFSPKECFRTLRKNKLISDKDTEISLQMVNDRNQIIHTYNKNFSEESYNDISKHYYRLMEEIYRVLNKNKN